MEEFINKWKNDPRFKTKTKLLLYVIFIVFISLYAFSIDTTKSNINNEIEESIDKDETESETKTNVIEIPEKYNYQIIINIDSQEYQYSGTKEEDKQTIIKKIDNNTTNYLYKDNEYYLETTEDYLKTTKEEVYDIINYNYINLDTINTYLNKATKENNQYLIYLKDIILGENSDEYFTIIINENIIDIDYTALMKQFNNNISEYKVTKELEKIK